MLPAPLPDGCPTASGRRHRPLHCYSVDVNTPAVDVDTPPLGLYISIKGANMVPP